MSAHPSRERLAAFAGGRRTSRREELLRHLAECAACRSPWLDEDPTRIFALLSLEPVSEHLLERLTRDVNRAVEREAPSARPVRRIYAVAAIAAALVLAAAFGIEWTRGPATLVEPRVETLEAFAEPPPGPSLPHPGIDLIESPGTAQVLDLSVGETQFVMIFDEALDI